MLAELTLTDGGVVAALVAAIGMIFKLYVAAMEKRYDDLLKESEGFKKSYQEIALEAVKAQAETTNYYRVKDGKPPLAIVAPVISESHSPSTQQQREAALIATLRAKVAAAKLADDQEPRQEPDHAK
jgi:hypothetical protein